jgi:hypothetical protein
MKRLLIALVFFALCGGAVTDGPAQILLRAGVFATGGGCGAGRLLLSDQSARA